MSLEVEVDNMTKKKAPQKIKPRRDKRPDAVSGRESAEDMPTAEENLGVHRLGKQDLRRHFGTSEAGTNQDDSKK